MHIGYVYFESEWDGPQVAVQTPNYAGGGDGFEIWQPILDYGGDSPAKVLDHYGIGKWEAIPDDDPRIDQLLGPLREQADCSIRAHRAHAMTAVRR